MDLAHELHCLVILMCLSRRPHWPRVGSFPIKECSGRIDLRGQVWTLALGFVHGGIELGNALVDIAVDHPHPIGIEFSYFLVKEQSKFIVMCLGESQVLESFDVLVEQTIITS